MKTNVLVVKAENAPIVGIENPKPNQIYKNPYISIEERPLGVIDSEDLRVEMIYVGVCGTDFHLVTPNSETGYISTTAPLDIPTNGRIIGHEGVGRVLQVGSNEKKIEIGMYVVFESIIVCNTCNVCRRGDFNQCKNAKLLGLEKDGLMGNVVDVPAKLAHIITDYVKSDYDLMALTCLEPAAVAYVACQQAQVKGGDIVVVFGAGPIGAITAMLCLRIFGASEVHVVEPIEFRRNLVSQWADKVYENLESLQKSLKNVDCIIEASGSMDNVTGIFDKIGANGRVVLLARSGTSLSLTNVDHMITNQISIKGSRGHLCGAFSSILELYRTGRIDLGSLVTKKIKGLDELKWVLENSHSQNQENCKIVVDLTT